MTHLSVFDLTELSDHGNDMTAALRPIVAAALTTTESMVEALANVDLPADVAERLQEEIDYIVSELEPTLPPRENIYHVEGQRYDLNKVFEVRAEA